MWRRRRHVSRTFNVRNDGFGPCLPCMSLTVALQLLTFTSFASHSLRRSEGLELGREVPQGSVIDQDA